MSYNNKSIKKFKGKLIMLSYTKNKAEHNQTGEITASTKQHILFDVNKSGHEIPLIYNEIINISKPEL